MRQDLGGYVVMAALVASAALLARPLPTFATATPVGASTTVCDVEPREFAEIERLSSTPVPSPTAPDLDGTLAPDDITAAITETVTQAVACANANDVLRSFALFTDRYLAERFGSANPDDLGSLEAALSRTPVPASQEDLLMLVSVQDVRVYDDVTASASVTTENRDSQLTDQLTFIWVDGAWLIDSWTPADAS